MGENRNGYGAYSPAQIFQDLSQNGTQRFIGSADAQLASVRLDAEPGHGRPRSRATTTSSACAGSASARTPAPRGWAACSADQTNIRNFSAKLVSNIELAAEVVPEHEDDDRRATTRTRRTDGVGDGGHETAAGRAGVVPGRDQDRQRQRHNLQTVNKTLGLYAQEQASFRDRMFLTVAARTDQNSSFGTNFQRVVYPKASLSWLISDESFFPHYDWLNNFRLRAAYGESGVQPGGTVALQTFGASTAERRGQRRAPPGVDTPGLIQTALGNPVLKPERSARVREPASRAACSPTACTSTSRTTTRRRTTR